MWPMSYKIGSTVHIANVWIDKAYYQFQQTYGFATWERIGFGGSWVQVRYDLRPTNEPGKFEIWGKRKSDI
jgi:hypothetical protein